VFSIWKAFGGNTRDLGSFGEETDKITDLHQIHKEYCLQNVETASQNEKSYNLANDVAATTSRFLEMTSGRPV
ncbi:hypothetical protein Tco_0107332, partial [Tanacetum coccineum]